MQSKISSFFKPSPCSLQISSDEPPLPDGGDGELAIWENSHHEIVNTYVRRAGNIDGNEANRELKVDTLKENISEDVLVRPEIGHARRVLNKKRSYAQLHLELGQSDFLLRTCSTCGAKYAPGDESDEKNHNAFHKDYTHGVPFKGWRGERIVHMPDLEGGRVILVMDSDPPAWRKKVEDVLKMMEIELGEGWILHKLCKVYLYVSCQRVAGCLVAEPIKDAFRVLPCSSSERSDQFRAKKRRPNLSALQFGGVILQREVIGRAPSAKFSDAVVENHSEIIACEQDSVPAVCGIRAIWVTAFNRRKGIATQLLEAVGRCFSTGLTVHKSQMAFSQPSSAGKALASTYAGTGSFLVYKPKI